MSHPSEHCLRARSSSTAGSLHCRTPTSALNPHPTVLLALIRFCWKDTAWAMGELFSPSTLTWLGNPLVPLCLQGLFLPAALPKTFNPTQRCQTTPTATPSTCDQATCCSPCTRGLGLPSTSQALTGVGLVSKSGLRNLRATEDVPHFTTFIDPMQQGSPSLQWGTPIPCKQNSWVSLKSAPKFQLEYLHLVPLKGTKPIFNMLIYLM